MPGVVNRFEFEAILIGAKSAAILAGLSRQRSEHTPCSERTALFAAATLQSHGPPNGERWSKPNSGARIAYRGAPTSRISASRPFNPCSV